MEFLEEVFEGRHEANPQRISEQTAKRISVLILKISEQAPEKSLEGFLDNF